MDSMDLTNVEIPSNISSLPAVVSEYIKLYNRKKILLDEKSEIDSELKRLKPQIIAASDNDDNCDFEISPNQEEIGDFGDFGALQVKVKNDYQKITRDNLTDFCIRFFSMLFDEVSEEDVKKLGMGQSDWMWANRKCEQNKYLERSYVNKKTKRRKAESTTLEPVEVKKCAKINNKDIPKTREDFIKLDIFNDLRSMIE
jgi:hypothetical protein